MSVSSSPDPVAALITGCLEEARFTLLAVVAGGVVRESAGFVARVALLLARGWRVTVLRSAGTIAAGLVCEGCRSTERCCRAAGSGESRCADIPSSKTNATTPASVAVAQNTFSFVRIGRRTSRECTAGCGSTVWGPRDAGAKLGFRVLQATGCSAELAVSRASSSAELGCQMGQSETGCDSCAGACLNTVCSAAA